MARNKRSAGSSASSSSKPSIPTPANSKVKITCLGDGTVPPCPDLPEDYEVDEEKWETLDPPSELPTHARPAFNWHSKKEDYFCCEGCDEFLTLPAQYWGYDPQVISAFCNNAAIKPAKLQDKRYAWFCRKCKPRGCVYRIDITYAQFQQRIGLLPKGGVKNVDEKESDSESEEEEEEQDNAEESEEEEEQQEASAQEKSDEESAEEDSEEESSEEEEEEEEESEDESAKKQANRKRKATNSGPARKTTGAAAKNKRQAQSPARAANGASAASSASAATARRSPTAAARAPPAGVGGKTPRSGTVAPAAAATASSSSAAQSSAAVAPARRDICAMDDTEVGVVPLAGCGYQRALDHIELFRIPGDVLRVLYSTEGYVLYSYLYDGESFFRSLGHMLSHQDSARVNEKQHLQFRLSAVEHVLQEIEKKYPASSTDQSALVASSCQVFELPLLMDNQVADMKLNEWIKVFKRNYSLWGVFPNALMIRATADLFKRSLKTIELVQVSTEEVYKVKDHGLWKSPSAAGLLDYDPVTQEPIHENLLYVYVRPVVKDSVVQYNDYRVLIEREISDDLIRKDLRPIRSWSAEEKAALALPGRGNPRLPVDTPVSFPYPTIPVSLAPAAHPASVQAAPIPAVAAAAPLVSVSDSSSAAPSAADPAPADSSAVAASPADSSAAAPSPAAPSPAAPSPADSSPAAPSPADSSPAAPSPADSSAAAPTPAAEPIDPLVDPVAAPDTAPMSADAANTPSPEEATETAQASESTTVDEQDSAAVAESLNIKIDAVPDAAPSDAADSVPAVAAMADDAPMATSSSLMDTAVPAADATVAAQDDATAMSDQV